MGTDFVKDKGAMALLNCAIVSTNEINIKGSFPFTWTMDALMMGVGVSYDTLGAGKVTIKQPRETGDTTFIIPDSREGWVESLKYVLDGYFHGYQIPEFDYSLIRPHGEPIKGFGGVACLTGDTVVYKDRKKSTEENSLTIKELFDIQEYDKQFNRNWFERIKLRCLDEDNGIFYRNNVIGVYDNGIAPVFEIKTKNGYKIKATRNHRFMTKDKNWQELSEFNIGNLIAVNGEDKTGTCVDCGKAISRRAVRCVDCNNKNQIKEDANDVTARQRKECRNAAKDYCEFCGIEEVRFEIHHIDKNPKNNDFSNLLNLCSKCHQRLHSIENTYGDAYSHRYLSFDEIVSIDYVGEERVYDIEMKHPDHNFIANGFVSHNSGPEPLMNLINSYKKLLNSIIGQKLTSVNIVDLMDMIGVCVVAGNVRRCLPEYYEVEVSGGVFKKIKDVTTEDKVIFNGNEYAINNVFNNGTQKTLRILTTDGYVECTPEHKWLVKEDANIVWKTADEISKTPYKYKMLRPKK